MRSTRTSETDGEGLAGLARNDREGALALAREARADGSWRPELDEQLAMLQDDVAGMAVELAQVSA